MNISQFLQSLIAISLDDPSKDKCYSYSAPLLECLQDFGLDEAGAQNCLLCPISRLRNSRATTCTKFEDEGFCEDCELCEVIDCPSVCWGEFEEWLGCKLGEIGCGNICQGGYNTESAALIAWGIFICWVHLQELRRKRIMGEVRDVNWLMRLIGESGGSYVTWAWFLPFNWFLWKAAMWMLDINLAKTDIKKFYL
jgi:hypothetical protein